MSVNAKKISAREKMKLSSWKTFHKQCINIGCQAVAQAKNMHACCYGTLGSKNNNMITFQNIILQIKQKQNIYAPGCMRQIIVFKLMWQAAFQIIHINMKFIKITEFKFLFPTGSLPNKTIIPVKTS